ncbi:CpaF family protein [Mobilitalea sibirica]|uniref:CpaF family protein n=1 Tax=Mobilitalea sibirica TaxID=1462919 RepID=A0A8J7KZV1_9FIRM|nr:CpaF family protein [Mobilitalea sibirica]MBH1941013.1 CpaF family protein [Mobilitalea sibirica]
MSWLKEKLQQSVLESIDLCREVSDDELLKTIDCILVEKSKENYISMQEKRRLRREIFNSIRKLDILQDLVDDKTITEIMVNGMNYIFIEKDGTISPCDMCFESEEKLEDVVQQIVSQSNRIINEANPIVDARLSDGSRVNIVLPPIAMDGPVITIRKFPEKPITTEQLIEYNTITMEAANFLKQLVVAGYNIFISGGTGSGKTTFLNVLSNFIPSNERIITIEDSAELQILNIPNLVRMEVRNANTEGENEITIRDLIKTSLRMRPDRIIVGEVRDGAAVDMLQAFNTGHDGSLSTGHANSPVDMLSRLETLVLMGAEIPLLAIRKQIASAIDIIVHLGRLRDKSRRVLEITEVLDCKDGEINLNPLYTFVESGEEYGKVHGYLTRIGSLKRTDKLLRAGIKPES